MLRSNSLLVFLQTKTVQHLIHTHQKTAMFSITNNILSILVCMCLIQLSFAQQKAIVNPPSNIKSVVLSPLMVNEYAPIIKLGAPLMLSFDDLDAQQVQYRYKIEHYDYNWKSSNLNATEFLNGFNDDLIRDFENSFNTLQDYTHYSVRIPNENISIKISGNYMISVLDEDDVVVFSKPFIVYEPLVDVGVSTHRSRDIATINTKHNVQFIINYPNLTINNPSNEIKVAVYQNNDWNTFIKDIKPQFTRGTQLLYKYNSNINFWAGNEYLFFDTKQIRNASNNIYRTELKDIFNTYLYSDEYRLHKPYTLNPDINGNFVLRTIDNDDVKLEGDYSRVHFSLLAPDNIQNDPIYIYGNHNDWQLNDDNKMVYDAKTKSYQGQLLLKQGFYNYKYVTAGKDGIVKHQVIDGSHFQTENKYTVIVYYQPFGTRYDQVIGVGSGNSESLRN